jgi:serine phosphatase RsbU (regulator of sigma subunit)
MEHVTLGDLAVAARAALVGRRYPAALLARLDSLTHDELQSDPWLALLQGRRLCRVHSRFAEATPLIAGALAAMRAAGEAEGELWAASERAVMLYHADQFADGVALADQLLPRPMGHYLRSELLFARMLCQIGLEQSAAAVATGEAALAELDQEPDPWLRTLGLVQLLRNIAAAYHYVGETRRSVAAAERAARLAERDPDLAHTRPWCCYELGLAYWRQGRLVQAMETLDAARRLAEEWRHQALWRWAVAAQGHVLRDQGQLDAALAAYQLAGTWGEDPEGPAFIQLRQGRIVEARWSCEARLALARYEGATIGVADSQLLLALVELVSGNPGAAAGLLDEVIAIYAATESHYYLATARLYRGVAGLMRGDRTAALAGARHYLAFAHREELLNCAWWAPELIEPLLIFALREGAEPEWARRLLARRFVAGEHQPAQQAEEIADERALARRVQLSLLPDAPPMMPDLEIAARVLPAAEIGGDFVAYTPRGGDPASGARRQLGLAVGDISGKGLGAALLLSGVVVALNSVAAAHTSPAAVAAALHQAVRPYTSRSRMNIGLLYAQLTQDSDGWQLRAVGAGAVPPLVRHAGGPTVWIETSGFPVGAIAADDYREAEAHLAPGDLLVLASDGVIEMMSPDRELFGFEGLAATLAALDPGAPAPAALDAILAALRAHGSGAEQHDDITLIVVRVLAGAVG